MSAQPSPATVPFRNPLAINQQAMVNNLLASRGEYLSKLLNASSRDLDKECGYPKHITPAMYRRAFDRGGVGHRITLLEPDECWAEDPELKEAEDGEADATEFEKAWADLNDAHDLWATMHCLDVVSGIGRYGVLLWGLDDGAELHDPVQGMGDKGEYAVGNQHTLLWVRCFDESQLTVLATEKDRSNPRYRRPTMYQVDLTTDEERNAGIASDGNLARVHWTRITHVADNTTTSPSYGAPRQEVTYNRQLDLQKLFGGSAEMFWKGAFPGLSFQLMPGLENVQVDQEKLKKEARRYMEGLQRYISAIGMDVKSLAVQVADPDSHVNVQLKAISIIKAIPMRKLVGGEQIKGASEQDDKTWNRRIGRRRNKHCHRKIVLPLVTHAVGLGILPPTKEVDSLGRPKFLLDWADLDTPSDMDRAEVLAKITEALAKYVTAGVDALVPPFEFLTMFADLTDDEAKQIAEAAKKHIEEEIETQAAAMEKRQAAGLSDPNAAPPEPAPAAEEGGTPGSDDPPPGKTPPPNQPPKPPKDK